MSKPRFLLRLRPLLAAFRAVHPAANADPAGAAVRSARRDWLSPTFLDSCPPETLAETLHGFAAATIPVVWHARVIDHRVQMIRHGLNHALGGQGSTAVRFDRCALPGGSYHVSGLGAGFWAAVFKALAPDRHPLWSAAVGAGLSRLGYGPRMGWGTAERVYAAVLADHPDLTATELDHFFTAVAAMTGRELVAIVGDPLPDAITLALREVRTHTPLRKRTAADAAARAADDVTPHHVWQLTGGADERCPPVPPDRFAAVVAQLEKVRTPDDLPGDIPPAELWLWTGLLHRRHPNRFPVWTPPAERGLAAIDDAFDPAADPPDRYRMLCDVADVLRHRFRAHPAEVRPLLARLGETLTAEPPADPTGFGGLCSDTFRFLGELAGHNQTGWMAAERDRYRFAVREPLVELCEAVADRYVRPVLGGEYGWDLETDPRPGRALTSITRTDFGRGGPYAATMSVNYPRRRPGAGREEVQLFIRLEARGVGVGFQLGPRARDAGRRFRRNVQEHGELILAALRATGATTDARFGSEPAPDHGRRVRTAADLRAWAAGKSLAAFRWFPVDAAVLRTDEFVGEVILAFDKLVPLFAAAVEDDPVRVLSTRSGAPDGGRGFDADAFRAATFLSDVWLGRATELLRLKKQLILQGVPGTGKTHVARALARHLTGDRAEQVRLVQFHPGYTYEEFVEGIRPKAVEVNGRNEVAYPVEPGLLPAFAARAAAHPADPHVLVVDEVNRGNLPRVFGELLFLLEYRDQEVTLPYSKKPFRLPTNLYLVGTMNPLDRSAVGLDQAVRRRFSFVEMPPDPAVLARWLDAHPPADPDPAFAPRLARWFEDLNRRLARDLGPDHQIGHSFFMVPDLTADRLRAVWEHHVRPAVEDLFPGRPDRVRAFDPDKVFEPRARTRATRV